MNTAKNRLLEGGFALKRPNTLVYLLRHANAESPKGFADADRRISDKGKRQCQAIKIRIGGIAFTRKYRSPLVRVGQTLDELGMGALQAFTIPQLFVGAGTDSRRSGVLDTAYQIMGNVGLAKIMEHSEVATAMNDFADEALHALYEDWGKIPNWNSDAPIDLLVTGHGWFNPLIAYYLTSSETARWYLLKHGMGEAETFVVGLDPERRPIWENIPCPSV